MVLRAVLRGGAFVVVGLVAFGAGVYADQALPDWIPYIANHQTGRVNTAELQDAIRVIQAEYVDGNLDTTKMSQGTISGLVASLGDPYSAYYDPDQYKKLQAAYEGRYSGIGVYVTFGSTTFDDFASVLSTNLASSKSMVLDLRDNPGGFVDQADSVISDFVASGETFEEHGRNGSVTRHSVSGTHPAASIPLVVLVNANSASAAEIVAGSLQVHERAKLVGAKTFGKGSEQQDFPLKN